MGEPKHIREILEENTIIVRNGALARGFVQLPRYILMNKDLSTGAKLTFAGLLHFAWQDGSCFPGQARLAEAIGVTRQSVNGYLKELERGGIITVQRRGQGKTNVYIIEDNTS